MYTIKWTGLQPTDAGWSPPSDTIKLRLLEANFLVEDMPSTRGRLLAEDWQMWVRSLL